MGTSRLEQVTKTFGANRAVDEVSLLLSAGEIVALAGENGAGKTTLMRIVAGELAADHGRIELDGDVAMVHQHFLLVPELSIAENLAIAAPSPFRFTSRKRIEREAEATIARTGIELREVSRPARELSVGEKAKLELIKALARRPSLLILDEPTSVLTPQESAELFGVIRALAANGTTIVFISHKVPEVLELAQRMVVMRRGRIVADGRGMSAAELANAMVEERRAPAESAAGELTPGQLVVSMHHVSAERLNDVSMDFHQHEIVAVIGVAGNGQSELAEILHGLRAPRSGTVIRHGLRFGFVPEDRTRDGLVAEMSIADNVSLREPHWRPRQAVERAQRLIDLYAIRARGPLQTAGSLSGGNQQKVILARELDCHPDALIASEPTRGLDLEATRFVHEQLRAAAARGAAILLITSDLDEAFELATAIHVIYRGRLSERLTPADASRRAASLMAGVA